MVDVINSSTPILIVAGADLLPTQSGCPTPKDSDSDLSSHHLLSDLQLTQSSFPLTASFVSTLCLVFPFISPPCLCLYFRFISPLCLHLSFHLSSLPSSFLSSLLSAFIFPFTSPLCLYLSFHISSLPSSFLSSLLSAFIFPCLSPLCFVFPPLRPKPITVSV